MILTEQYWDKIRSVSPEWDLDLPQNQVLMRNMTNILSPIDREGILSFSPYLARHTQDIGNELMKNYEFMIPSDKITIVECFALGLVVDTAAILSSTKGRIVISRNLMNNIRWDENRNITEFDFYWNAISVKENIVHYYTQYYVGKETPNAVVFQPKPSAVSDFGEPVLLKEVQTALELIRLSWMEMVCLKNGGMLPPIVAVPDDINPTDYEAVKKQFKRGIEGNVTLLKINSKFMEYDFKLDKFMLVYSSGKMTMNDFNILHEHLLEDSPLPQRELSGISQPGAMGGQAPKVDLIEANSVWDDFRIYLDPLLDNFVTVFGKENENLIREKDVRDRRFEETDVGISESIEIEN